MFFIRFLTVTSAEVLWLFPVKLHQNIVSTDTTNWLYYSCSINFHGSCDPLQKRTQNGHCWNITNFRQFLTYFSAEVLCPFPVKLHQNVAVAGCTSSNIYSCCANFFCSCDPLQRHMHIGQYGIS